MNPHLAHALGISSTKTGLPAPKPAASNVATRWIVRWHLEGETEVYGCDSEEAAREARTALEDLQGRIDAMPSCWAAGGELSEPVVKR